MTEDRLTALQRRRDQLNAQIQRESAKQRERDRKERDSRLMRWGVALDSALANGHVSREWVADLINQNLNRQSDRRRAFTGPLAPSDPGDNPKPDPQAGGETAGE